MTPSPFKSIKVSITGSTKKRGALHKKQNKKEEKELAKRIKQRGRLIR